VVTKPRCVSLWLCKWFVTWARPLTLSQPFVSKVSWSAWHFNYSKKKKKMYIYKTLGFKSTCWCVCAAVWVFGYLWVSGTERANERMGCRRPTYWGMWVSWQLRLQRWCWIWTLGAASDGAGQGVVGGPASERRCSDWIPSPDHCHSTAEEERATVSHCGEGHLTASTQLTSQYMHLLSVFALPSL